MNVTTTLCGSAPQSSRPGVYGFQIKYTYILYSCTFIHATWPDLPDLCTTFNSSGPIAHISVMRGGPGLRFGSHQPGVQYCCYT